MINLDKLSDTEVVGLTIYGESRGEPIEGQIAVGCVIRNRVNNLHHYKDVCLAPLQFSCWNANDPNRRLLEELGQKLLFSSEIDDPRLSQCLWIADGVIHDVVIDITHGAQNYLTTQLYNMGTVTWAKDMRVTRTIGLHTFLA